MAEDNKPHHALDLQITTVEDINKNIFRIGAQQQVTIPNPISVDSNTLIYDSDHIRRDFAPTMDKDFDLKFALQQIEVYGPNDIVKQVTIGMLSSIAEESSPFCPGLLSDNKPNWRLPNGVIESFVKEATEYVNNNQEITSDDPVQAGKELGNKIIEDIKKVEQETGYHGGFDYEAVQKKVSNLKLDPQVETIVGSMIQEFAAPDSPYREGIPDGFGWVIADNKINDFVKLAEEALAKNPPLTANLPQIGQDKEGAMFGESEHNSVPSDTLSLSTTINLQSNYQALDFKTTDLYEVEYNSAEISGYTPSVKPKTIKYSMKASNEEGPINDDEVKIDTIPHITTQHQTPATTTHITSHDTESLNLTSIMETQPAPVESNNPILASKQNDTSLNPTPARPDNPTPSTSMSTGEALNPTASTTRQAESEVSNNPIPFEFSAGAERAYKIIDAAVSKLLTQDEIRLTNPERIKEVLGEALSKLDGGKNPKATANNIEVLYQELRKGSQNQASFAIDDTKLNNIKTMVEEATATKSTPTSALQAQKQNNPDAATTAPTLKTDQQTQKPDGTNAEKGTVTIKPSVLSNDIGEFMNKHANSLHLNPRFNAQDNLEEMTTKNPTTFEIQEGSKDLVMGFAAGMLAKLAGKTSPFSKKLDEQNTVRLPDKVIEAVFATAKELAKAQPNLKLEDAITQGKAIGKNNGTRNSLFNKQTSEVEQLKNILSSEFKRPAAGIASLTRVSLNESTLPPSPSGHNHNPSISR